MHNQWTQNDIEYLQSHYRTQTDKEISEYLQNHSESSVATKRKRLGLERTNRKYTFDDVVTEFNKTDYILMSGPEDYIDAATNSLQYVCPRHKEYGIQKISLGHLQSGRGCYYCGRERTEGSRRKDLRNNDEYKQMCEDKGVIFIGCHRKDGHIYVDFQCPNHMSAGIQTMRGTNLKRNSISGCPHCAYENRHHATSGEQKVIDILNMLGIEYIPQYIFSDCVNERQLIFDFYLPVYNACIEFDGVSHFIPRFYSELTWDENIERFNEAQKRDRIKDVYCQEHGIQMIRVTDKDRDNLKEIFQERLGIAQAV